MAITASDIQQRYSGGAANTDPDASIGGAMSTAGGGLIADDTLNNDMDDITGDEAEAGITIYHGYFYKNNHGSLTYISPVMWISSQTSSADTSVEVAIADEAKNTAIETLADEETAPGGTVTFSTPSNKAAGLAIGDLDAGDYRGHWVKYIVGVTAASVLDTYTLAVEGDTLP